MEKFCILYAIVLTLLQLGNAVPDSPDHMGGMNLIFRSAKDQLQSRLPFGGGKKGDELNDDMELGDNERRKREINFVENMLDQLDLMSMPMQIPDMHREKRSPCRGGANTTAAPADDTVDGADGTADAATRKRGRKGNARKARNKQQLVRQRRQADDNSGQKFNADMKKFSEAMQNVWQTFVTSVKNVLEEVNKAVTANGATADTK
ncbi:uncharacterized protein LOC119672158 [Teleopsis dalmanni]|uniref:uncharacterized protein LOC119672158 n=1 Tax=Teleopsis dalmanni TaxID=139649 RepID=UPI0018CF76D2|nr:uncharacterized protein LOC119672158 [Teleopsis dalmanni]